MKQAPITTFDQSVLKAANPDLYQQLLSGNGHGEMGMAETATGLVISFLPGQLQDWQLQALCRATKRASAEPL